MYEHIPSEFLDPVMPNPNFNLHGMNIPFRGVVVAPSGSGKTSFVTNLISIFSKGQGTFQDITILCRDKDESLYRFLQSKSDRIIIKEGIYELPPLDKFDKEFNHLVIIDDLQLEKHQERICEYYIRCRKKNVSILYLAQNYFSCPKEVRDNCNYLFILRITSERELPMVLKDCGCVGVSKECLMNMYDHATNEMFSPFIINKQETNKTKKFRRGLIEFLNPADYK